MLRHHPFTSPKIDQLELFMECAPDDSRLKEIKAEAYDCVLNGYELGGGSIRIHQNNVQNQMFKVLGFSEEEAKSQFGFFLEALEIRSSSPRWTLPLGWIEWLC